MACFKPLQLLLGKNKLSVKVQFAECTLTDSETKNVIGTVNHAMFYISDPKNNSIHRVHCINGFQGEYHVNNASVKYKVPRDAVGKGFRIPLTPSAMKMTGAEFADKLAELPPGPWHEGDCQWWLLTNLFKFEKTGLVEHGTALKLIADKRIDSHRLMDLQNLKDKSQSDASEKEEFNSMKDLVDLTQQIEHAVNGAAVVPKSDTIQFNLDLAVNSLDNGMEKLFALRF